MSIGEQLRKCRKEIGISQEELGKRLNISQQQIAQYENGRRIPKIETLHKIADALNISISKLLDTDILNLTNDIINLFANSDITSELSEPSNPQENYLLTTFRELNETGKKKACDYISDLTQISEYRRE